MKRVSYLVLFVVIFTACSSAPQPNANTPTNPTLVPKPTTIVALRPWWDEAIFYEIFVRSFYDTNGDGIGDFAGITQKLDYLQSLGISAIWLMPIYPSPSYHGYDVIDYFNVNSQYGTLDDFKRFLREAHRRGMHVILDLELNHTSNQNPWFIDSNANQSSSYRDWYIWSSTNPGYLGPVGKAWYPGKYGYYYAIFGANMPDLNYRTPAVTTEMEKVVKYWLNDIGVDGFRIDASNYLIEEGQKQQNTQSTHEWLKKFYTSYKNDKPDAFTIGEVFGAGATQASTYTGNQMDMVFNFELASGMINSVNGESSSALVSALTFANLDLPSWQFGSFLTNHDQNRVMSALSGSLDKAKTAAFLLLTSPGTPFIYYGEEIGMQGEKPDEDIRRPMQWTGEKSAGFTSGTPWRPPDPDYINTNVAKEKSDPNSLLSYYQELIAIHKANPVLRFGALGLITTNNTGVFADLRYLNDQALLMLVNLTEKPIADYDLNLTGLPLKDGVFHLTAVSGSGSGSDLQLTRGGFANYKPLSEIPAYGRYLWQLNP
ncbi:MAG: alpha-amylase family glycosyl hydrolase [Chloroflexi bacterium]|nr:alpha-amylase family glycosyl hydrolase [Chloroflexota bacterium]